MSVRHNKGEGSQPSPLLCRTDALTKAVNAPRGVAVPMKERKAERQAPGRTRMRESCCAGCAVRQKPKPSVQASPLYEPMPAVCDVTCL